MLLRLWLHLVLGQLFMRILIKHVYVFKLKCLKILVLFLYSVCRGSEPRSVIALRQSSISLCVRRLKERQLGLSLFNYRHVIYRTIFILVLFTTCVEVINGSDDRSFVLY